VELNALGAAGLIDLIEAGLFAHRADTKVIPPADVMRLAARGVIERRVAAIVAEVVAELVPTEAIASQLAGRVGTPRISQATINRRLRNHSPRSWVSAVADEADRRLKDDDIRRRARTLLRESLAGQSGGAA
jgi:hypothetical protein